MMTFEDPGFADFAIKVLCGLALVGLIIAGTISYGIWYIL